MQKNESKKPNIRNPSIKSLKSLQKIQNQETSYSGKVFRAALLIVLAACFSAAVQLNLVPVYGGVGASLYHVEAVIICVTGYILTSYSSRLTVKIDAVLKWLPLHTLAVPTILHSPLFYWSSWLGPSYGPAITELLTSLIPVVVSFAAVAEVFKVKYGVLSLATNASYITLMFATGAFYVLLERYVLNNASVLFSLSSLMTRATLLLYISCIYSVCFPSILLLGAVPSVTYMSLFNPHMPWQRTTERLNQTLHKKGFSLLERRESVTGYVSVLENLRDGFRILRCDHSLLGGEWLVTPERVQEGIVVPETIYSAFTMLEAVTLMTGEAKSGPKGEKVETLNALVIGLGIGTSPKALAARGIDTAVVELDPAVIEFSRKYFDLPPNVNTINQDAIMFVKSPEAITTKYNFIIHDVFTGGAEPAALFTLEFFENLRNAMKPSGTIAINYTGDLNLESAATVLKTITEAFESCRAFRDSPLPYKDSNTDFVNLVIFCTKSATPWTFREPTEADFLQSQSRRQNLPPKFEMHWEDLLPPHRASSVKTLRKGNEGVLNKHSQNSALGHWKIMRNVLPDAAWVNW